MTRKKITTLTIALTLLVAIGISIPFLIRPIELVWEKRRAHQIFKEYTPEEMRNMNAVPISITLPKPHDPAPPLSSFQSPRYLYHFSPPQSQEFKNGTLRLTYPQFKISFLPPVSTRKYDADFLALVHEDLFQRLAEVAHARPDDIDAQSDLKSLSYLLTLLSEKHAGFSLSTYYAQFDQNGRRGFISATHPDQIHYQSAEAAQFHAVIYFSPSQLSCGMYFSSDKKIDPANIQSFLSALEIEPGSPSTLPATQP